MEDMAQSGKESIPETRINTYPGTPFIILSPSPSSSSAESTPYVVQSPSPVAAPDLAERLHRLQMVQRGLHRPSTPYPIATTRNTVRGISPVEPGSITPSAFLSISTFIPPHKPTPNTPASDVAYPTVINWDQPVLPQPETISREGRMPIARTPTPSII
ncbi:hypothetical protein ARMGADRAFT_1084489 [Armillaria gallica]|uniref:Uncharacterized protein n=1 Tax=Armillaria gallica TaxID=47427 RepID=A0A2H3DHH7_ARMGA|nr:hypothetical protein ARMGADRAFT_1084489 [Armillaria gallica]